MLMINVLTHKEPVPWLNECICVCVLYTRGINKNRFTGCIYQYFMKIHTQKMNFNVVNYFDFLTLLLVCFTQIYFYTQAIQLARLMTFSFSLFIFI